MGSTGSGSEGFRFEWPPLLDIDDRLSVVSAMRQRDKRALNIACSSRKMRTLLDPKSKSSRDRQFEAESHCSPSRESESYNRPWMPKTVLKLLAAGTVGFLSILGAYGVLAVLGNRLPLGTSNATLIATMLLPIPIGLFIAWAAYRILERI